MLTGLILLAVAASLSLALTPILIRLAHSHQLFDHPDQERRVHTRPVPRLGGVALVATFVATLATLAILGRVPPADGLVEPAGFLMGVILGGGLLFAVGLVDDLRGVKPLVKLLAQIAAGLLLYQFGYGIDRISTAGSVITMGWFAMPLTVLWVVAITNAFNLIDGLDGLATGIAIVALGAMAIIAGMQGRTEVLWLSLGLVGGLIGFLRYNFNPARIFLGDSGSLFIGFMLAALSLQASVKSGTAALAIAPMFALALPLFDTGLAVLRRWIRGLPLSAADRSHVHHRLLALGITHRRAVLILYATTAAVTMVGLVLAFSPPAAVGVTSVVSGLFIVALIAYGMRRLDYREFGVAGVTVGLAALRLREVVRMRVYANDIAHLLPFAGDLREVNAILQDAAEGLHLVEIVLRYDGGSPGTPSKGLWTLDYPLANAAGPMLRLRGMPTTGFRSSSAERIAAILAPGLEEWLGKRRLAVEGDNVERRAADTGRTSAAQLIQA